MKHFIVLFLFTLINTLGAFSQQTTIYGKAQTYAGDTLLLKTKADLLSTETTVLGKAAVGKEGEFRFEVSVDKITPAFIHLDVFEGYLFLEAGKSYEIVLPQKTTRILADKLNPFFEPMQFYFQVVNSPADGLNTTIRNFDTQYNKLITKYFNYSKTRYSKKVSDSLILELEQHFGNQSSPYFLNYKKYKYLQVENLAYLRNSQKILNNYYIGKPLQTNNPAYLKMLIQTEPNLLHKHVLEFPESNIPKYLITDKSYHLLKNEIASAYKIPQGELLDLLLTQALYKSYTDMIFPEKPIFAVLDSIVIQTSNPAIRQTAENIRKEISALQPNSPAPEIVAHSLHDSIVSLSSKKGKFVYLVFCSVMSYPCQKQMALLEDIQNRYGQVMDVVSVLIDSKKRITKYSDKIPKNIDVWYNIDNKYLEAYKIKVYPTYLLIGPEGQLIFNPAVEPDNPEFEARFVNQYKAWKREHERHKQELNKGLNH